MADVYAKLDKVTSFLTISSIFIAIVGSLKLYFSFLLYNIQPDFHLIGASFFSIFSIYSFNKLTDAQEDLINAPPRTVYVEKNKYFLISTIILSYAAALILCFLCNLYAVFIVLCPLLIGFIYSIKIRNFRLKDKMGMKNISVGISWAVGAALLPLAVCAQQLIITCLVFYFFFIKSIINTVLFDVRDMKGDSVSGIKTIPVFLGINKTKKLLILLNSTIALWLVCCYLLGFFNGHFLILGFSVVYGYWYIHQFCRMHTDLSYRMRTNLRRSMELLIDGEWIVLVTLALLPSLWRSINLSLIRLTQNIIIAVEGLLSYVSIWALYFSVSLLSLILFIYVTCKINKFLDIQEEPRVS